MGCVFTLISAGTEDNFHHAGVPGVEYPCGTGGHYYMDQWKSS